MTTTPAVGDADHPGTYIPSPEGNSANMHLIASAPRTGSIAGYRNSDLGSPSFTDGI